MNETTYEPTVTQTSLRLNEQSETMLVTIAKWSRFLGILTFVVVGFMFLLGLIMLFAGSALTVVADLEGFSMWVYGIMYFVGAVLYLFPGLYLYRYSVKMKQALDARDEVALAEAFHQQKNLFVYMGVISVVSIVIVILALLAILVAALVVAA